jgi:hypothetical protein
MVLETFAAREHAFLNENQATTRSRALARLRLLGKEG